MLMSGFDRSRLREISEGRGETQARCCERSLGRKSLSSLEGQQKRLNDRRDMLSVLDFSSTIDRRAVPPNFLYEETRPMAHSRR